MLVNNLCRKRTLKREQRAIVLNATLAHGFGFLSNHSKLKL